MVANPVVSIGLPVYNGENYLACAIEAILAQSSTDFELTIYVVSSVIFWNFLLSYITRSHSRDKLPKFAKISYSIILSLRRPMNR